MKSNFKQAAQNQCAQKKLTFKEKLKNFIFKPFKSQKSKNTNLKISLFSLVGVSSIGCFAFHWVCGIIYLVALICSCVVLLSPVIEEVQKNEKQKK